MPLPPTRRVLSTLLLCGLAGPVAARQGGDPLPSWRDGTAKRAILGDAGGVPPDGARLACDRLPSALRAALYGQRLPADPAP